MADDPDDRLAHELAGRDPAAWGRAYDGHAGDVFRFIAHLLRGDKTVAEEVHQDTWLAALAGIDSFEPRRGPWRAWIFGIARRQVALHFRRLGSPSLAASGDLMAATGVEDGAILPQDVIDAVERGDAVRAALMELDSETRGVLLGKYVDGRSVSQLAEQFSRSPKAIESLLSRSRSRMRRLLNWYFDNEAKLKDVRP